jgi:dynein heavy chain
MHPNADITFQQQETKLLIDTVITCTGGGGGGGGGGMDADTLVIEMAKAIEARLQAPYDIRLGHVESFKRENGKMISLGVFLTQECSRFNDMMAVMAKTLGMLQRAIKVWPVIASLTFLVLSTVHRTAVARCVTTPNHPSRHHPLQGLIVMSGELEDMFNCFMLQRTPGEWENAGYPCLKPLNSWVEDHFRRLDFMRDWVINGPPVSYWISGFFFPQGFMTAVKQTYSRKYHIAVDILVVGCEVTDKIETKYKKPPADGVYTFGAYMQGARFDFKTQLIMESEPKVSLASVSKNTRAEVDLLCVLQQLFAYMPVVWLKASKTEDYDPGHCYNCPVYKTSLRKGTLSTTGHSTNYVVGLDIPIDRDEDYWIRCGTALLLMLDT